jgi:hypothetical protein
MGVIVPVTLFLLLDLRTMARLFTIAATSLLAWGAGDLLARILERPRLKDRTAGQAWRDDLERRSHE